MSAATLPTQKKTWQQIMETSKQSNRVNVHTNGDPTLLEKGDSTLLTDNKKKCNQKRADYLSWDEYFMASAFLSAQRSKDPRTQVGACIVNEDNKIVGIGYNGMPIGCSDDLMPWGRDSADILETKQLYVCHAELNAVLNKNSADVKNCRIYVALFPCNECAKVVIQSGIREVVYYSDKYAQKDEFKASRRLLDTAGVKLRQFRPERKQIVIDFESIEPSQDLASQMGGVSISTTANGH